MPSWLPSVVWLALLILFSLVEAATVGLVSVWFAAGALTALLSTFCTQNLLDQLALFILVSALSLALVRPLTGKFLTPRQAATNADRLLGRTALVTEEINDLASRGAVQVSGVEWSARSDPDQVIPVGTAVRILRIEGVKLIVTPVQNRKES